MPESSPRAPRLVELEDFSYARARNEGVVLTGDEPATEEAMRHCPVQAIRVLEQ